MPTTALVTRLMEAKVGPCFLGHFGYLHALSLLMLASMPVTHVAARRSQAALHRNTMLGLYVGGLLIADGFALMPERLLQAGCSAANESLKTSPPAAFIKFGKSRARG